jgi:hypothetical protein
MRCRAERAFGASVIRGRTYLVSFDHSTSLDTTQDKQALSCHCTGMAALGDARSVDAQHCPCRPAGTAPRVARPLHTDFGNQGEKIFAVTSEPELNGVAPVMSESFSQFVAMSSTVTLSPSLTPLLSTTWALA